MRSLSSPARRLTAVAALLFLLAGGTAARAEGEEPLSREFSEHNFRWTIPATWHFEDPSESDAAAGFVAVARRSVDAGKELTAYVSVRDAGTTPVSANLGQVKENKAKALQGAEAKVESAPWAGVKDAGRLTVMGKAANGSTVAWFVFAAIVKGKYTQLDLRSTNGAHHDANRDVSAVVRGFRFIDGVPEGGEEGGAEPPAPEAPPPGEGAPPAADDKAARERRFEKLGLSWTLPEPSVLAPVVDPNAAMEGEGGGEGGDAKPKGPQKKQYGFAGAGKTEAGKGDTGDLCRVLLLWDDVPVISATLYIPTATSDVSALDVIKLERNFEGFKDAFDGSPIPAVDEDTKVGNTRGASRTMTGKSRDGKSLWIRVYATTVKGTLYFLRFEALDNAHEIEHAFVKALVGGLKWDDTKSGARGPVAVPFRSVTGPRPPSEVVDAGKKTTFDRTAISLTKPAKFDQIKFSPSDNDAMKPWVFAAEAREGDAFLFVGIMRIDAAYFLQAKPPAEPESFVDELENQWKNEVDEAVTRPKSEKTNRQAASFRGARGASFEFRGKKEGHAIVQKGWVVRSGANVFVIRAQFGGADAEKLLGDDWDALSRTIKFK